MNNSNLTNQTNSILVFRKLLPKEFSRNVLNPILPVSTNRGMGMSQDEWLLKICIIGGNSDLNYKFSDLTADFVDSKETYCSLGVAINRKGLEVVNQRIRLIIMVCAGQERFRKLRSSYLEGSGRNLILFDKGKRKTFEQVSDFYKECRNINDSPVTLVGIVGEPQEEVATEPPFLRLAVSEEVTTEEGQVLADKLGIQYVETAIHDREKVEEILLCMVKSWVKEISTQ
jgi:GTPase SAR1 family protein